MTASTSQAKLQTLAGSSSRKNCLSPRKIIAEVFVSVVMMLSAIGFIVYAAKLAAKLVAM